MAVRWKLAYRFGILRHWTWMQESEFSDVRTESIAALEAMEKEAGRKVTDARLHKYDAAGNTGISYRLSEHKGVRDWVGPLVSGLGGWL